MINLKKLAYTAVFPFFWLLLISCGEAETAVTPTPTQPAAATTPAATPTTSPEPVAADAIIDSIQIVASETPPVTIEVRVRGTLPDGCTNIDQIISERNESSFQVRITTLRPAGVVCTAVATPYEEVIPLEVLDLPAGTYAVAVNGVNGSFTLASDNTAQAAATPEATATSATADSAINGRIWHDLCTIPSETNVTTPTPTTGTPAPTATPAPGCIPTADGASFQANGLLETEEPGIAGITVDLGEGECPATGVATAVTDSNGEYLFTDLPAGTYCISVDPLSEENSELLLPGGWTFPEANLNTINLAVASGQTVTDVNFGWDYKFLPLPEVDLTTCTKSIEFIEDLTIPDNTVYPPGAQFEKGWRLRNSGTCPWTTDYSLALVGGDDTLGAPEFTPLENPVVPGQVVDVFINLTATATPGTYRANFQISDENDLPFGINGFIGDAFWVQIVVEEGAAVTPQANSASISGVVWRDFCTILSSGAPSANCVDVGGGFYRADGTINSNEQVIAGAEVTLSANACPQDGVINPANVLETAVTDTTGTYSFTGLDAGTYCVAIDAFDPVHVNLFIPGDWTYPAPGTGRLGVLLGAGEQRENVDFGWDDLD